MSTHSYSTVTSVHYDPFKKRIAFLIAVVTMITSMIGYLQGDASARDAQADRDIKWYAIQAQGRKVSDNARLNYDEQVAYQAWYELDILSLRALDDAPADEPAAKRYETLRDRITILSPLLRPPYFDFPESEEPDIARYEAETHRVEVTVLTEQLAAASVVKNAWDNKADTYIIHLTLLAVSLFLFGLSITIAGRITRWIFSSVGLVIVVVTIGWAAQVWRQPVLDLRTNMGAIDAFASGVGLAHQERWQESLAAFDEAIQTLPDYTNAFVERGHAYTQLDENEAAVADYERARALGNQEPLVARELAWNYYLLGRFDDSMTTNRIALEARPDYLRVKLNLALSLLAAGQVEAAPAEYKNSMDLAARQVAEARAAEQEPSSDLWRGLDRARLSLDDLLYILDTGEAYVGFTPEPEQIADPEAVYTIAPELIEQLKSLAVALEYTGEPPIGELTADISPFEFGKPVRTSFDDEDKLEELELSDVFSTDTPEVILLFDYEGMQDGDLIVLKVYQNEVEVSQRREISTWEQGSSGEALIPVTLAYGEGFAEPAEYAVELYVNGHLAQSGWFEIVEE